MLMQKVYSTHGRLAHKPVKSETAEEPLEEHLSIQDQIENLRIKIGLKERFTKVLAEEFEESRQGSSSILRELYNETRELRLGLILAITSESQAIQNALRTQNEFHLALGGQVPHRAILWLEDKLLDARKEFNVMVQALKKKREKLENSELHIIMIEKWPRPGTLPWEIIAYAKFHKIETVIQNVRIRRETAFLLNAKYHDIKNVLQEERGKYIPNIRMLENQFRIQKSELKSLNKMLHEANTFRRDTLTNLLATEREARENRKVRRKQMAKMRKTAEKTLTENHAIVKKKPVVKHRDYTVGDEDEPSKLGDLMLDLKRKKDELVEYEERSQRIVKNMRVNDLTQIPARWRAIQHLTKSLEEDKASKVKIRDKLVKQRDHLELTLSHVKYDGAKEEEEIHERLSSYETAQESVKKQRLKAESEIETNGDAMVNLRLSTIAILGRLEEGDNNQQKYHRNGNLKTHLRNLYHKTKTLAKDVEDLESYFEQQEKDRPVASSHHHQSFKPPHVPLRLIRTGYGQPVESESDGDDDDLPDSHVPGRLDIKTKSQRVKQQAILKRGLK